jgi:hypothetical protein
MNCACEKFVGSSWSVIPHKNLRVQLEANKSRALLTRNDPFHETQAKKALDGSTITTPTAAMSNNNIPYQIAPCKLIKFESIET